ncbi:MAG: ArsA-related P-loop ATPase [Solirubrobacterales bacterium]
MNVGELLEGKQICICAGSGGVGKTTTSAAIAMEMAARGGKVAVLTIDPAKRLANALGLRELGNEERLVDPQRFAEQGIEMKGELWAMMLDAKRTFDDLIERHAPDEETRDRVLGNRIYQELSNAMAGSQEYMAMEKLYELHQEARYDLLVLDTPPTRNALDFIQAPERMTRFIEGRSLQFFLRPGRLGMRVVGRSGGMLFSVLKRITGIDLLQDLSDFFQSFGDMAKGFSERAQRVNDLLAEKRTTFLLVSAPEREPIDEAVFFWRRLREAKLPFGGVIVNKVHPDYLQVAEHAGGLDIEQTLEQLPNELERSLNGTEAAASLARRIAQNFSNYRLLAERDRHNIERLTDHLPARRVIEVPYLDTDVHDLDGLAEVNRYLFSSDTERREILNRIMV